MKSNGFISKIGYGTWEIIKPYTKKELKKTKKISSDRLKSKLTTDTDSVRGHAFMFKLKIPNIRNWDKRESFLNKKKISYKPYFVGGHKRGQQFKHKAKTLQLTKKSIIIQTKESYISRTAKESKSYVIYDLLNLIKWIENKFKINLKINGKYKFKVSRQHYALMNNALAKQYNKEGKKLKVYNEKGLWFLIDDSFNLAEAETVHKDTAVTDNQKVQNFFNGIQKFERFTPEFIVDSIARVSANQELFANNIQTHIKAIQDLGTAVNKLTELVSKGNKGDNYDRN